MTLRRRNGVSELRNVILGDRDRVWRARDADPGRAESRFGVARRDPGGRGSGFLPLLELKEIRSQPAHEGVLITSPRIDAKSHLTPQPPLQLRFAPLERGSRISAFLLPLSAEQRSCSGERGLGG